jgi:hypothetical protein
VQARFEGQPRALSCEPPDEARLAGLAFWNSLALVPLARSRARGLPTPHPDGGRADPRTWRGSLHGTSCWFGALRAYVPRGKGASAHPGSYLWRAALILGPCLGSSSMPRAR